MCIDQFVDYRRPNSNNRIFLCNLLRKFLRRTDDHNDDLKKGWPVKCVLRIEENESNFMDFWKIYLSTPSYRNIDPSLDYILRYCCSYIFDYNHHKFLRRTFHYNFYLSSVREKIDKERKKNTNNSNTRSTTIYNHDHSITTTIPINKNICRCK